MRRRRSVESGGETRCDRSSRDAWYFPITEIVPMESGWLVLKCSGDEPALQRYHDIVQQVMAGIRFDFGQK